MASPEEHGGSAGHIRGAAGGASDHQAAGGVEEDTQLLLLLLLQLLGEGAGGCGRGSEYGHELR